MKLASLVAAQKTISAMGKEVARRYRVDGARGGTRGQVRKKCQITASLRPRISKNEVPMGCLATGMLMLADGRLLSYAYHDFSNRWLDKKLVRRSAAPFGFVCSIACVAFGRTKFSAGESHICSVSKHSRK